MKRWFSFLGEQCTFVHIYCTTMSNLPLLYYTILGRREGQFTGKTKIDSNSQTEWICAGQFFKQQVPKTKSVNQLHRDGCTGWVSGCLADRCAFNREHSSSLSHSFVISHKSECRSLSASTDALWVWKQMHTTCHTGLLKPARECTAN